MGQHEPGPRVHHDAVRTGIGRAPGPKSGSPRWVAAAPMAPAAPSIVVGSCKHTETNRPPGRRARARLVKAASGVAKNMVQNRLITVSKAPSSNGCAKTFATPILATRVARVQDHTGLTCVCVGQRADTGREPGIARITRTALIFAIECSRLRR